MAKRLSHPASLAYATYWVSFLYHQCRDIQKTRELTDISVALSTDQGFAFWPPLAAVLQGWVLSKQGQVAEGIVRMRQGLEALQAGGTEVPRPHALGLLADAYKEAGQAREGLSLLDDALAAVNKSGSYWAEAELRLLKGELLMETTVSDPRQAEICLDQALVVAHGQEAKSLELRAAMSLSRLWQMQGKRDEARKLLAEIYGWFTEGFDTADLKDAKALLDELT